MKKLSIPQLLVLNAYWVGLSFMWNALHPIILPAVLLNYVPGRDDLQESFDQVDYHDNPMRGIPIP